MVWTSGFRLSAGLVWFLALSSWVFGEEVVAGPAPFRPPAAAMHGNSMPDRGLWAEEAPAATSQQLAPASFSYWFPVVAHGAGFAGTDWRTGLGLLSRSGAGANVELRFYGLRGMRTGSMHVAHNEQSILVDVVD